MHLYILQFICIVVFLKYIIYLNIVILQILKQLTKDNKSLSSSDNKEDRESNH